MIKTIHTAKVPAAIGPYSQALNYNNFVFCSGQIGLNPKTGKIVEGIENQTNQVLTNIREVLKEAGTEMNHVLKTTIFLTNINDFPIVNKIYENHFGSHKPARSTVAVAALPKGALVEVEVIAIV